MVKSKTFLLVSEVLSFWHTKQASKNVVETSFSIRHEIFLKHKVLEEFSLYEVVLTHFVKGGRIPLSLWMNSVMLYCECFLNPIFSIRLLLTFKWLKCYWFYWLVLFTKILPLLPEALAWNLLLYHHWSFCFPNHLLRLLILLTDLNMR